ncbi:MAG: polysaccharide biosynthesis/export family protein [Candidatus Competibacteraceae bacterium]|nr:polysaccharide biosynthesis/export family protein [Candidatus Competibacteraceae bacterium]MBK8899484.1 polysaccharide biosynthesis/export family protein [Candidatus Competibacteraceae bacterium]MBK9952481.1 polysaccharide biosynthesis/export family protein [Candidatus Competibacteraceae bacterium]
MSQHVRILTLLCCLLASACVSPLRPEEQQPLGFEMWRDELPDYGFLPGDELDVKLIYNPEFSDRVIVSPDGLIHLSLIGSVKVLDRTPGDIAEELRQRYATEFRHPEAIVVPRMFSSEIIYVGGEVQRAGVLKLAHRMGVLEGVLEAGGFRETARMDRVILLRRTRQGKPMLKVVNVRRIIEGGAEQDVPLRRFDMIYVPRSDLAEVNLWLHQLIYNNLALSTNFGYTINRNTRTQY